MRMTAAAVVLLLTAIAHANALPYKVVKMAFGAGYEPHRAAGERGSGEPRQCAPGYYKRSAGAYPCKQCPVGFIAPEEGSRDCTECSSSASLTSDATHTTCVDVEVVPANERSLAKRRSTDNRPKRSPARRARRSSTPKKSPPKSNKPPVKGKPKYESKNWKALATIPVKATPCHYEQNGSRRCGIPIGYWDNTRTGSVFFPANYKNKARPYMLLLHGSGWTGSDMINVFKDYAIKYKFAIIAPDSHNAMYWSSPDTAQNDFTADFYHIQACWDAVMKMNGVKVDPKFVSSFGNSRAAYAAVSYASRSTTNFNSAAILHAAALPQQMGKRVFPIQWITGSLDPLYGPVPAKIDVARFRKQKPAYKISWQIWKDNHTIRNYTQIDHMIKWWLDPSIRDQKIRL